MGPPLADLLPQTGEQRSFEAIALRHWWGQYADRITARESSHTPEEASAAARRYAEEVTNVLPG